MSTVRIQAEISGYLGPAVNLLAALDTESGLLIVAKELQHGERDAEALISVNDPRAERDTLFDEDRLQRAIRLFFRAKGTGMLELLPAVSRHDPEHKIETNGIDETGTRYRLSPDITNGAIAVLALVEAADKAYTSQSMADLSDEICDMFLSI